MMPFVERTDVEKFRFVVAGRLGLHHDNGKLDFLADVLGQRMVATGCLRFEAYLERLAAHSRSRDELRALAEQLTVGETFFFRYTDHFRAFAGSVLPERLRARAQTKRLRVLSAGCSTGEEPYSVATLVREALPDHASWDLEIVGLDINPSALAKAVQGRYSAWSLRATSEEAKRRYFRTDGREFILDDAIRKMVAFEERNLVDEDTSFWQPQSFDVVFCRNVIMYFTPDMMQRVVLRIARAIATGGYLFLGHAETLRGLSQDFHLCHTHDTFYYRRRLASEGPSAERVGPLQTSTQLADKLPAVVEATTSWVEVIQKASERIASLAGGRSLSGDELVRVSPAMRPVTRSWDLGLVIEAMRQERFSEALEILVALPPDAEQDLDALLLRAVLLTNGGKLDEAESVCTRLLALDELNAGAHYLMALCREHAGDSDGAIEHDQTAVYLDPGFAMARVHLGLAARRLGDMTTARRELGQALMLLAREDTSRLLLFGGGFTRETLVQLCRTELRAMGGEG